MGKTLFEKIWESHIVVEKQNNPTLIYIEIGRAHVWTPVTLESRMPSSALKKKT